MFIYSLNSLWAVALGGALGACTRFILSQQAIAQAEHGLFPWSTFWINIAGCAMSGFVWAVYQRYGLPNPWRALLSAGFLGGFTTFSAFSLESFLLLSQQAYLTVFSYILGSLIIGLASLALMYLFGKMLLY